METEYIYPIAPIDQPELYHRKSGNNTVYWLLIVILIIVIVLILFQLWRMFAPRCHCRELMQQLMYYKGFHDNMISGSLGGNQINYAPIHTPTQPDPRTIRGLYGDASLYVPRPSPINFISSLSPIPLPTPSRDLNKYNLHQYFSGNSAPLPVPDNQSMIRSNYAQTDVDCASKCLNDPACQVYGWMRVGEGNEGGRCDLYDYYDQQIPSFSEGQGWENYQVGTKIVDRPITPYNLLQIFDVDDQRRFGIYQGAQVSRVNAPDMYTCAKLCMDDQRSVAYGFNQNNKTCDLYMTKLSQTDQEMDPGYFIGKKRSSWS